MTMEGFRIKSESFREFLAELLGTFVLTCIGCSANAASTLAQGGSVSQVVGPLSWGLALTAAIYVCGGVSGGHVNPAVTLGLASVGKLPWRKVIHYFAAQYIGAFLGAVVTYLVYREALNNIFGSSYMLHGNGNETSPHYLTTAGIFGTMPNPKVTTGTTVIDQIVAVSFFLMVIMAVIDEKNMACPKGLIPIAIGLCNLGLLVFAYGFNCGAPINPARDLAPRIFTAIAGWGSPVFGVLNYNYFWVPVVACHVGGVLGCWIYKLFIENHWPCDSYDLTASNGNERSYVEMNAVKAY